MAGNPQIWWKALLHILRKFNKLHTEQTHMSTPRHSVMELSKDKDKSWKLHERLATRNWAPMCRDSMPASQLGARNVRVTGAHLPVYTRMGVLHTHVHTHAWERPKACARRAALAWALSGCVSGFLFLCSLCLVHVYFLFSKITDAVPLKAGMY